MTIVANDSITVSNVNDGTITHTAWSYSADGTDGFTTVYPNLNLLEGTKDFSGDWWSRENWENDGTYKGLSVKRKVGSWGGITKQFIAPKDGVYTFSAYLKSSAGESSHVQLIVSLNDKRIKDDGIGSNFDWLRNSFQVTLKTGDRIYAQYNMTSSGTLWTAGHKWEEGSTATPYMQSASEVTTADYPSYIGQYTDFVQADSTNPSDYTWSLMRGNDGKDGVGIKTTTITYVGSTSGTTAPTSGWTSTVPTVAAGSYLWTKTVWTYTYNSSETGYSVAMMGLKGDKGDPGIKGSDGTSGIIVSSVAPASPQTGQLWQDTSTTPQLVKKWTGSEWVIWELYVENMNVNNLSALSTNLGDINGGTLKLMADDFILNGQPKMYGIYQSKFGLISSGPTFETTGMLSNTQMGVASLSKGELRFMVTDYTEDLKNLRESGMNDPNSAFIKFNSYENGKDVMTISSSGDIVFKGNTSQDTPWVTLSSGVKYKFMFSRMYISVDIVGNGNQFMQFGMLPQNLRPISDQFLIIANWGTGTADDRHIHVRASDGAVILWAPKSGVKYSGEVSFTL